jgi:hypothetical protein
MSLLKELQYRFHYQTINISRLTALLTAHRPLLTD